MKLNEQIREHRKKAGLTQEQVALALGVTTPAVNKWESGSNYPDITLLAPLARLLGIDLNTLFTFREGLSREEAGRFCNTVAEEAYTRGFRAGFSMAEARLREYPNCDLLRYSLALLLEGSLARSGLPDEEREGYERQLTAWYEQAAAGQDGETREAAVGILANRYLARGDLEGARRLIDSLPEKRAVDKQMLKINLALRQGDCKAAAVLAETEIFSRMAALQGYWMTLIDIDLLLEETGAASRAAELAEKTAELFGFWEFNRYVCPLRVALAAKDAPRSLALLAALLEAAFAPVTVPEVFRHMPTKPVSEDFGPRVVSVLLRDLESDPEYDFLRGEEAFQGLLERYRERCPEKGRAFPEDAGRA